MHKYLKKSSQSNHTVVTDAFQGKLQVTRSTASATPAAATATVSQVPFFKLSLDLPTKPLFREDYSNNNKSQEEKDDVLSTVSLFELLEKFNGQPVSSTEDDTTTSQYGLTSLPKYLILHVKRFSQNNYTIEKNGTIVSFPLKNLDMRTYLTEEARANIPLVSALDGMSNSALKGIATRYVGQEQVNGIVERPELISVVSKVVSNCTKYDLVANVGHKCSQMSMDQGSNMIRQTNPHDNGMYHAQVYHRMGKQWYSIQDLSVQEVPNELITKSEVLMLLYERKDVLTA